MSFDLGSDAHIVNRPLGKMQLFLSDHLRRPSLTRKENKSSLDWSGPEVLEVCTFDDCRLVLSNPKSTFRWNCEPVHEVMSRNKLMKVTWVLNQVQNSGLDHFHKSELSTNRHVVRNAIWYRGKFSVKRAGFSNIDESPNLEWKMPFQICRTPVFRYAETLVANNYPALIPCWSYLFRLLRDIKRTVDTWAQRSEAGGPVEVLYIRRPNKFAWSFSLAYQPAFSRSSSVGQELSDTNLSLTACRQRRNISSLHHF